MENFKRRSDIGQHVQSPHELTDTLDLPVSSKMIYCYLSMFKDGKTGEARIRREKLQKISGYSENVVREAVKNLVDIGLLHEQANYQYIRAKGHPFRYTVYTFPMDMDLGFERITFSFLQSQRFTKYQKELIVCLMPLILDDNKIGYSNKEISDNCGQGMGIRKVEGLMSGLTKSGFIEKLSGGERRIHLDCIMFNPQEIQAQQKRDLIKIENLEIEKELLIQVKAHGTSGISKALNGKVKKSHLIKY